MNLYYQNKMPELYIRFSLNLINIICVIVNRLPEAVAGVSTWTLARGGRWGVHMDACQRWSLGCPHGRLPEAVAGVSTWTLARGGRWGVHMDALATAPVTVLSRVEDVGNIHPCPVLNSHIFKAFIVFYSLLLRLATTPLRCHCVR